MTPEQIDLPIHTTADVERAHQLVRAFSRDAGLTGRDVDELVLATSEIARNLLKHTSAGGSVSISRIEINGEQVVQIEIRDSGPGIPDIGLALQEGYTTGSGLGSGLSAARRNVDTFTIDSSSEGTTIRLHKRIKRS